MKKKVIAVLMLVMLVSVNMIPVDVHAGDSVMVAIDYSTSEQEIVSFGDGGEMSLTPYDTKYVIGNVELSIESSLIKVYFDASASGVASKIGFKNIYIRTWNAGSSAYSSQKVSDLYNTNTFSFEGKVTISNPVAGKTYQIIATCFAIINGVECSYDIVTEKVTF